MEKDILKFLGENGASGVVGALVVFAIFQSGMATKFLKRKDVADRAFQEATLVQEHQQRLDCRRQFDDYKEWLEALTAKHNERSALLGKIDERTEWIVRALGEGGTRMARIEERLAKM